MKSDGSRASLIGRVTGASIEKQAFRGARLPGSAYADFAVNVSFSVTSFDTPVTCGTFGIARLKSA